MNCRGVFVGLDVGGTKIEAAVAGQGFELSGSAWLPIDAQSAEGTVGSIVASIEEVLAHNGLEESQILAIGIGVPGQVQHGVVRRAVNLNFEEYPLKQVLHERFQAPLTLENDMRVAALGALDFYSRSAPLSSLAFVGIGTGISAGLILDGKIYRGHNRMAGEIGHATVLPGGPLCKCGMRGCLEALASGTALAQQAQGAIAAGEETSLRTADPLDARAVYQAHSAGDPVARRIVQQASAGLAIAIQWLIMGYDVEKVVLGGGVTREGEHFLEPVLAELARIGAGSDLARDLLTADKIEIFPADTNAGVLGALALAKRLYASLEIG